MLIRRLYTLPPPNYRFGKGNLAKGVALFWQKRLNLLFIDNPYLIRSSPKVFSSLREDRGQVLKVVFININDMYNSLPHDRLLRCIEDSINTYGAIAFQNAQGISQSKFLNFINVYLMSTFATWDGYPYLQKKGVCIGSCIAPVLTDLYLAHHDRNLKATLDTSKFIGKFYSFQLLMIATLPPRLPTFSTILMSV